MLTGQTIIWLNYWHQEKRFYNQTVRDVTTDKQGRVRGKWVTDGGSIRSVTKASASDTEWREA